MRYKIDISIREIERRNYHLFIELLIGNKPSRMLIDTGASKTVLDRQSVLKFVKEDKIVSLDTKSVGLGNSEVETCMVKLKELSFGKMKIKKLEVAVLDLSHVNQSYNFIRLPQIDGVLGSDFLMKHKAVIHYEKKALFLKG